MARVAGRDFQSPTIRHPVNRCTGGMTGYKSTFHIIYHPINYTCIIALHGGLHGDHLVRTLLFSTD